MAAEILALPDTVEILVQGKRAAVHSRSFQRHATSELPVHRERLLFRSCRTKFDRIFRLIQGLGLEVKGFLSFFESSGAQESPTVRPQDERLPEIRYEARRLDDYDDLI